MERILIYHIPATANGLTIEKFLRLQGYSRPVITHLKKTENGIMLNHCWARTTQLLTGGDELTTTIRETTSSKNIEPVDLPLHIVYEDEDIMVINKSADTPIHPSQGNYLNTLANAVAYYFDANQNPFVYRCLNRLDRDTTGLLIVAKHMLSSAILSNMIKERQISRTYLALTKGHPQTTGTVCAPIGRLPGSTIMRQVDHDCGEYALTHYQVLASYQHHSLVQLKLETGRTHQIRVHMSYLGHPLLGDFLYNPSDTTLTRQALHSSELAFTHPITGKAMHFNCPLPEDMAKLCH